MPAQWDGRSKEMGPVQTMGQAASRMRDLAEAQRSTLSLSTDGPPLLRSAGVGLKLDLLEKEFEGLAGDILGMGDVLVRILLRTPGEQVAAPAPTEFPSSEVGERVEVLTKRVLWARAILQDLGGRVDL